MSEAPISFERAIEVFVREFCFTRTYTHPYLAERVDGAWVMRDSPHGCRYSRVEEYVAHGIDPPTLDDLSRRHARGAFRICVMVKQGESDSATRDGFRALKYRLMTTEAFMVHALGTIPTVDAPISIVRIETQAQADILHKETRRRQMLPDHLAMESPPVRQYMAVDGEKPIGWAQSIVVGNCTWCSNVYVSPEYRRRGIARSLLCRLLSDDRDFGAEANVLLASHAGAKLYPVVGYETIGQLLMFTPPRNRQ